MITCNDKVTQRNDMTKNLNIRLEDETFEAFTQWCNSNRYSKTEILKDYIEKLISGEIQPLCNASNDIGEAIANHPKITAFEDRLEGLESTLNQLLVTLSVNLSESVMTCNESNALANNNPIITDNDSNDVRKDNDKEPIITDNDTALPNQPSENALEAPLNENQGQSPLEATQPVIEAKSDNMPGNDKNSDRAATLAN